MGRGVVLAKAPFLDEPAWFAGTASPSIRDVKSHSIALMSSIHATQLIRIRGFRRVSSIFSRQQLMGSAPCGNLGTTRRYHGIWLWIAGFIDTALLVRLGDIRFRVKQQFQAWNILEY